MGILHFYPLFGQDLASVGLRMASLCISCSHSLLAAAPDFGYYHRCRQVITRESIEGAPCVAICSPDVEMAVMKRSNETESVPISNPGEVSGGKDCGLDDQVVQFEQPAVRPSAVEAA